MRDKSITDQIRDLERDLQQMKTTQFSGSTNNISYESQTADTWDVNWTPTTNGIMGYAQAVVQFTLTTPRFAPFSQFDMSLLYNDAPNDQNVGGFVYFAFEYQYVNNIEDAMQQRVVTVVMQLAAGNNIKIKGFFTATDAGVVTKDFKITIGS